MKFRNLLLVILSFSLAPTIRAQTCLHDFASWGLEADQLVLSGRLLDAEYLVRLCRQQWAPSIAAGEPKMLATAAYLGQLLGLLGRWREAESVLQEAYRQALAGSDSQSIGVVASSLGSIYRYQGNTARALPLLRVAHRRLVEARGPTDYAVGVVLTEIGLVQASDGKMITAKSTFVEAKSILAAAGTAAEVVTCDLYLGATEIEQGQFADGEVRIQNALRTIAADDQTALASAGRAMGQYYLARVYSLQGRKGIADVQYRRAIAAYEMASVQPFPRLQKVMEEYSVFLKKGGSPTAKAWAARARALRSVSPAR